MGLMLEWGVEGGLWWVKVRGLVSKGSMGWSIGIGVPGVWLVRISDVVSKGSMG